MLHSQRPLLRIRIQQCVGIASQGRRREELVIEGSLARTNVEAQHWSHSAGRKCRQRHGGNTGGKSDLPGRGGEVEDAGWPAKRVVGLGVIDYLRVIDAKARADDGCSAAAPVICKADARCEILAGICERLLLIAQPKIHGEIRTKAVIVLDEKRPESVVDGVTSRSVT